MSTHALRAAAGGETEAQDSATLEILLKALMAGLATILTARIGAIAAVAAAVAATLATEGVHQLARRRNWGVKRVGLLVAATVALGSIDSKLARGARRLFGEGSRVVDAVAQGAGHVVLTTTAATALTVSAVTVPELATGVSILADRPSTFFSARETDREAPDLERTFEITLGRVGRLAFDAERGDRVFVELTDATTGTTTLTLQAPDGSSLASTYAYPYLDTTRLPATGTYTVTVDPWDNNSGSVTLRIVRVV